MSSKYRPVPSVPYTGRPEYARPEPREAGEFSLPEGTGPQPPHCPDRLAPPVE